MAAMDGLVEQKTACIARPTNQGSHGRGADGGRHSPWGSYQRVADRDPTRGNRADNGVDACFLMHITASVLTLSAMPGLATSILPGVPGAVMLLTYIWTR
jgi:hypothetical protein